jgi:hypothetical protein
MPSIVVSLPIADRRTSLAFCGEGLGFEPVGDPADDGVPEPLQFALTESLNLMLVPTGASAGSSATTRWRRRAPASACSASPPGATRRSTHGHLWMVNVP